MPEQEIEKILDKWQKCVQLLDGGCYLNNLYFKLYFIELRPHYVYRLNTHTHTLHSISPCASR